MGVVYRLQQFWQALTARPLPATAWQAVATTLTPAEQALFERFSLNDQRHSYQVWETLWRAGHRPPSLLGAALLHDVGKTCVSLNLIERSLVVLVFALSPGLGAKWGQGDGRGWRRPFWVKARHPEWGAEMAAAAGSETAVVQLIRYHQMDRPTATAALDVETARLLALLQWADDQN